MHYLLVYDVAEDYLSRRAQFRVSHLNHVRSAYERGELVLGGALAEPTDAALIVFRGNSSEPAELFAKSDPYVTQGLVKSWQVRKWMTVIGDGAIMPDLT